MADLSEATPLGSILAGVNRLSQLPTLPEWAEEHLRDIDHQLWSFIGDVEEL